MERTALHPPHQMNQSIVAKGQSLVMSFCYLLKDVAMNRVNEMYGVSACFLGDPYSPRASKKKVSDSRQMP